MTANTVTLGVVKTLRRLAPAALVATGAVLAMVTALFVTWSSWYFTSPGYADWVPVDGLDDCNDAVPPGLADGWQVLVLCVVSLVAAALVAARPSRRRGALPVCLGIALIAMAVFSATASGSAACDWLDDSDTRLGPGVPLLAVAGGLVLAGGLIAVVRNEASTRTGRAEAHPVIRVAAYTLLGLSGTSAIAAVAIRAQGVVYTYMGLAVVVYAARAVGLVAGLGGAGVFWYRGWVARDPGARRLAFTLATVCLAAGVLTLVLLSEQPALYDD